ncbi:MAG TPA: hypothetical protein VFD92_04970 [Candidatus Binatia bacterium]|nr:hypothetical protein [Candidatus Binatia bacterium]
MAVSLRTIRGEVTATDLLSLVGVEKVWLDEERGRICATINGEDFTVVENDAAAQVVRAANSVGQLTRVAKLAEIGQGRPIDDIYIHPSNNAANDKFVAGARGRGLLIAEGQGSSYEAAFDDLEKRLLAGLNKDTDSLRRQIEEREAAVNAALGVAS